MKTGFIRALWGVYDRSNRITNRRFRTDRDITRTINNQYQVDYHVYVYGKDNAEYLKKSGINNFTLVDPKPFAFDLIKHCYRNKLELMKYAVEVDKYDRLVYLDWDCNLIKQPQKDFWSKMESKKEFQANLIQYKRIKAPWRTFDLRKVPNGGFIYLGDTKLIHETIRQWETQPAAYDVNDEIAWAKLVEKMSGGWKGSSCYFRNFEPMCVNLRSSSPFTDKELKQKELYWIHKQGGVT